MSSSQMAERVLFVHAHPDDETISTGGTIAVLVDRGSAVTVLMCTSGERGEVIPEQLASLRGNPDALATHRRSELATAMSVLGVTDHRYLGQADARWPGREPRRYTDSGMRWASSSTARPTPLPLEEVDPSSLTAAELGEVAADIAAVISATQPHVVVSYDENGGYGHPDHVRAHEATRVACEVLNVPFFVIANGATRSRLTTIDVSSALDRKRAALGAHRSQLTVTGDEFVTPGGAIEPIVAIERFHRHPPSGAFDESGWATKVATTILAAFLGVVVGAVLTVVLHSTVVVAGVTVPWGLIAATVVSLSLVAGIRLVFESRVVAAFAAVAMLGSAAVVALTTPVGPALDNPGVVLVAIGLPTIAFVRAWPPLVRAPRGKVEVPRMKGSDLP